MPNKNVSKNLVLFIHGFGSSKKCWAKFLHLLKSDSDLSSTYEWSTWEYPTKWVEINLFGRIPSLKELGRSLADEIDSPKYRNRSITLVGHSQGGLVIQSYFSELLQAGQGEKLKNIRQAIFFATPSEGSTMGMSIRLFLSTFFRNPQETTLRVLNPDVADIRSIIRERLVGTTKDSNVTWRIPIHAFCGLQDNIVPEASARGPFDNVKRVPGNHFTILKPQSKEDSRYSEFAELLLDPGGHRHRFEVEKYQTVLRVEPRPLQTLVTANPNQPREISFDNYARLKRTVTFCHSNKCKTPFTLRYGTRQNGYVVGHPSHQNEASPADKGRWDDTGAYTHFDFTPEAGQEFSLDVEIYKGFDSDNSDVHFHLGNQSHVRAMEYVLDLTAYITAGRLLKGEPKLFFYPRDREHSDLCRQRDLQHHIGMTYSDPAGLYKWELKNVTEGVVDIDWELVKIPDTPQTDTREQFVE